MVVKGGQARTQHHGVTDLGRRIGISSGLDGSVTFEWEPLCRPKAIHGEHMDARIDRVGMLSEVQNHPAEKRLA
jgi:hypothetical protein